MSKKLPEFITRIQAEGTATERRLEAEEVHKKASALAAKMPPAPDKQVYVGNLLRDTMRGQIDVDVFKEFVKMTNTYLEVDQAAPRIKMMMNRGKSNVSNTRGH